MFNLHFSHTGAGKASLEGAWAKPNVPKSFVDPKSTAARISGSQTCIRRSWLSSSAALASLLTCSNHIQTLPLSAERLPPAYRCGSRAFLRGDVANSISHA
ncbi:hypothetical protein CC2G_008265 [Coprinopsis cinerea AmutBmut pab1-1]|nr:hypothetical protein CC2G_008265 [Coprinopsis cinerea AmutBmut pab1-1]